LKHVNENCAGEQFNIKLTSAEAATMPEKIIALSAEYRSGLKYYQRVQTIINQKFTTRTLDAFQAP
jgi:hypothetical protein